MTESALPFGTVEEAPALEPESESSSRRNLVALGALAAVLVAGGAGFFLLTGGEDTSEDVAFVPPARTTVAKPAVAAPKAVKLPVATNVPLGRNPFKALYVQPAAAPATTGDAPVPPPPVATRPVGAATPIIVLGPGSTTPAAPPAPAPLPVQPAPQQPPAQQPAPQQPAPQQPAPQRPPAQPAPVPVKDGTVTLADVTGDGSTAQGFFRYEGKVLRGGQGDVMGGQLLVVSLTESDDGTWVAVLKRGDGGPFEVREGETVVVS